jgi:hypothetical protein
MRRIRDNAELKAIVTAGVGFILNVPNGKSPRGKKLHSAHCRDMERSDIQFAKYYSESFSDAEQYCNREFGPEGRAAKLLGEARDVMIRAQRATSAEEGGRLVHESTQKEVEASGYWSRCGKCRPTP